MSSYFRRWPRPSAWPRSEAAQAGVPVVANDIDVLRERLAVGGRPCALFVNANDTGAFATAVQRLVEDRQLAAVLASRGTQLSQRYSLGAMVERYAGLIEAVARRSWRPAKAWSDGDRQSPRQRTA